MSRTKNGVTVPAAKTEYLINNTSFHGGLNLSEPPWKQKPSESPEMQNLFVKDGVLCCRDGQSWLTNPSTPSLGTGYCFYGPWHGYFIAHISTYLYAFNIPSTGYATPTLIHLNLPQVRGTFFEYGGYLYYKTDGAYCRITATWNEGQQKWTFSVNTVVGYKPVILINAEPTTGSGTMYQPENRYSAYKTVWYTSDGTAAYHLPVIATSISQVYVNDVPTTAYTYDAETGILTFPNPPAAAVPPVSNNVKITYYLMNTEAFNAFKSCRFVSVYGGATGELCIVTGGSSEQPNAYFWNGNTDISMDPSYFPITNFQLAGDISDPVTGFGKQQSYLVIFKEKSLGRAAQGTEEISGRVYIDMAYIPINSELGCDLPWSIKLVENNLVWCNTSGGVFTLLDTSSAYENNVRCVSRKINGEGNGLLADLAAADPETVCAGSDGSLLYICANQHAWVWDYSLSTRSSPAWFLFNPVQGRCFQNIGDKLYHLNGNARIAYFARTFEDYGAPIQKIYRSATQTFGNYNEYKNVNSVNISLCPETESTVRLTYITDFDTYRDPTDLSCSAPPASGRSFPCVFRRRPMSHRVLHFAIKLENYSADEDLAISSAEVYFNTQGRIR